MSTQQILSKTKKNQNMNTTKIEQTGEGNAPRVPSKYVSPRFNATALRDYNRLRDANAELAQEVFTVSAQRDELLAACKRLCDLCDRNEIEIPTHELTVIGQAQAAIAKAEQH